MFGKSETEEMRVAEANPPRHCVLEAESRETRYRSEFSFEQMREGATRVRVTFGAEGGGRLGRLVVKVFWPMLRKSMAKALQRDLDDLAHTCQS